MRALVRDGGETHVSAISSSSANITHPRTLSLVCHRHRGASSSSCRGNNIHQNFDAFILAPTRDIGVNVVKIPLTIRVPLVLADTIPSTASLLTQLPKFPCSPHLSTLPNMGRVFSTESFSRPPVRVIKLAIAETFDRPPLLLSQISVVKARDLTQPKLAQTLLLPPAMPREVKRMVSIPSVRTLDVRAPLSGSRFPFKLNASGAKSWG